MGLAVIALCTVAVLAILISKQHTTSPETPSIADLALPFRRMGQLAIGDAKVPGPQASGTGTGTRSVRVRRREGNRVRSIAVTGVSPSSWRKRNQRRESGGRSRIVTSPLCVKDVILAEQASHRT